MSSGKPHVGQEVAELKQSGTIEATQKCILVLCGLPGAGKTTLTAFLISQCKGAGISATGVSYDTIVDEVHNSRLNAASSQFDLSAWKAARSLAFQQCAAALDGDRPAHGRLLVIIDDNMYYRSMRHAYFRLARDLGTSYAQAYLPVSLETALERNGRRGTAERVPEDVIKRMWERFEAPEADKHPWERNTVVVETADLTDPQSLNRAGEAVLEALEPFWSRPAPALVPPPTRGPPIPATLGHQLDLDTRKAVSEAMAALPKDVPPEGKRTLAASLASTRVQFLRALQDSHGPHRADVEALAKEFRETCQRGLAEALGQQLLGLPTSSQP